MLGFASSTQPTMTGSEAQFWALENPLHTPNYALKYGMPAENSSFNFLEVGKIKPTGNFVTRSAPSIGTNVGGAIEVVTEPESVQLDYLHMR